MNFEKYKTFTAQDFVFDDHFRDILAGKLTPDYSLAQLKEDLPEKSLEIDLAVNIIKDLDVTVYENSDTRKLELWGKVVAKRSREIRLNLLRYTAVVFLVIGSEGEVESGQRNSLFCFYFHFFLILLITSTAYGTECTPNLIHGQLCKIPLEH